MYLKLFNLLEELSLWVSETFLEVSIDMFLANSHSLYIL